MKSPKHVLWVLILGSIVLFGYSSLRAYRLSFTCDESVSYKMLLGTTPWDNTSADHRLNTRLMRWTYRWLGAEEWQLRLPNLAGHLLYLVFGFLLLRHLKHWAAMLAGFAFLNLNPFLLDFFSLARGYGLALGLSMAAVFFLRKTWQHSDLPAAFTFSFLSMICASLSVLANYVWLNLHLSLLAANLFLLLSERGTWALRISKPKLWAAAILTGANVWFLTNVIRRLLVLRATKELGNRGEVGFVSDTIGSLIDTYFYVQPFPYLWPQKASLKPFILPIVIGAFLVVAVVLCYRIYRDTRFSFPAMMLIALGAAIAVPIGEFHILGVQYPIERIALYYVPLAGVLGMFFADESISRGGRGIRVLVGAGCLFLACAMLFHISRTANLNQTLTWHYDAHTKEAMLDIGRRFGNSARRINIGNDWLFEPTLNYYRHSLQYDWMTPPTRDRIAADDNDLVYCFKESLTSIPYPYTVLERYTDPDTVLIEIKR